MMKEADLFSVIEKALPGRAFLMLAPMGTREPYLILTRVTQSPQNTIAGYAYADRLHYRIDSYARTYADALANLQRAIALLRACPDQPLFDNEQDMYEQDTRIHHVTVDLTTWIHPEPTP